MKPLTFVLASKNKKKLAEMQTILGSQGIRVLSQAQAGVDLDPEETGLTFEENAIIKARAVSEASGLPAIADDSGLMVDALDGAPGVFSARYGGSHELSDEYRWKLLLKNMEGMEQRTAKYVSVIAAVFPDGRILTARGECHGEIAESPRGDGGFCGMTGKQRAYLRAQANGLDTILYVGKGGITEAVIRQTEEALAARELIKGRVLEASLLTAREACEQLAEATGAEGIQTVGSRFVLYRPDPKEPKYVLPKA